MTDVFQNTDQMWFGTRERMQWIDTPNKGANVSPTGMLAESDLINGGAFVRNSADAHKNYAFTWGDSADRRLASILRAYRNGSYGRGLIYFLDPMYYETNLLPQRWADPSMALDTEAPNLTGDRFVPSAAITAPNSNGLPVRSAFYSFPLNANYDGLRDGDSLFIPIPPGSELLLSAFYAQTGNAYIKVRRNGVVGETYNLTATGVGATVTAPTVLAGGATGAYAELYLGTATSGAASTLQIAGITARLRWPGSDALTDPFWYTGEGHSGCRFSGSPTVYNNDGIGGGHVSLSCELKETGSWE